MFVHSFVRRTAVVVTVAAATVLGPQPVHAHTSGASVLTAGVAVTPIKHVVIIFKENRSFDGYFGRFPGADGATTALKSNGVRVNLTQTPDPVPNDVGHAPNWFKVAYDGGKMDGFDKELGAYSRTGIPLALSQMREFQIPNYWAYARTYALGDHMFADWKGASFTNNLYQIAAQAGRYDASLGFRSVYTIPVSPSTPNLLHWGCDDPPDTYVYMLGTDGSLTKRFPCFNFRSLPNVLAANGVSWSEYTRSTNLHNALDALTPVRRDPALWSRVVPYSNFQTQARAGTLPAVSFVQSEANEHPPRSACAGENETVNLVNSVMSGADWKSTAIFVVWDEWGGFYDHVPPPQIDNISYGFRTPLLVSSPWTKTGTSSGGGSISHTFYSHVSLLKFIEDNWSLPSMTPRDQAANDMMDTFNFAGTTRRPTLRLQTHTCPSLTLAEKRLARAENPD